MIRDPVIIIGPPRSGTTLLYSALMRADSLWSLDKESHRILEGPFHPALRGWKSNELSAKDLSEDLAEQIRNAFEMECLPGWVRRYQQLCRDSGPPRLWSSVRLRFQVRWALYRVSPPRDIRLVEKTPKNCLRIPFLQRLFPDASFIVIARDGRATISSMMDAWRKPAAFDTYTLPAQLAISGCRSARWCFLLPDGWRSMLSLPLEEVCARQWLACVRGITGSLPESTRSNPVYRVKYEAFIRDPKTVLSSLFEWLGLPFQECVMPDGGSLRVVNATSPPREGKWRVRNGDAIVRILPLIKEEQENLGYPSTFDDE